MEHLNQHYFVSPFLDIILRVKHHRRYKLPNFSKFTGEIGESTLEHMTRYQNECGDIAANEYLKWNIFEVLWLRMPLIVYNFMSVEYNGLSLYFLLVYYYFYL